MAVYSFFCGSKIDAHNKSSAEWMALFAASDAAFVAAIKAFSTHDHPTPQIRSRRIRFLMRYTRCTVSPDDNWVRYYIRHSDRSSIVQGFGDYWEHNRNNFFQT